MLVTEMIELVRQGADEDNTSDISDTKILRALNLAMQKLTRLSTQHFPQMLKRTYESSDFDGRELEVPALSLSSIVNQVDVKYGGVWYPVTYNNTTNVQALETNELTAIPTDYSQLGNKLLFYPRPYSGITARVRYQLRAPKLVTSQGRITSLDTENGYLFLDSLGSSLTTSTSSLGAFINVINKFTGDIVGTYQVNEINTGARRLTIKSSALYRETVFGLPVSTELSELITEDDYVTVGGGSCIPLYYTDYADYLIQHAVVAVKRSLNLNIKDDKDLLDELEEDVKLVWAGRPTGIRVVANNRHWNRQRLSRRH